MEKITILTGAGISAESGLGTFRDADGVWSRYDLSEVATPEGFARDPAKVHDFYNARRKNCLKARPNAAHHALSRLEAAFPGYVTIVTQNVDNLHEQAGSQQVIHMHGELLRALCAGCGHRWEAPPVMDHKTPCPACAAPAIRPDIVWFGEMPYRMDDILQILEATDLFVAIGTSGQVYPAAGFVRHAREAGARSLELNLEPSEVSEEFDVTHYGAATRIVSDWVAELVAKS